ncbi:MAG: hypothetical protein KDD69_10200 [Bdellovibrionales bacterium]|nr:hypothetical protein [Bdellovibrionales bacterium]
MKRMTFRSVLFACGILMAPWWCAAQEVLDTTPFLVELWSPTEVLDAHAIIVFPARHSKPVIGRREASVRGGEQGSWSIVVRLQREDLGRDAHVMVIGKTTDGTVASPVHKVDEAVPGVGAEESHVRCPVGETQATIAALELLDEQALGSLVALRRKRKELLEQLLKSYLSEDNFERWRKLEYEANLRYAVPLDADLSHEELALRLQMLRALTEAVSARGGENR